MKTDLIERVTGSPTCNEICGILHKVYQAQRQRFEPEAGTRGVSLETLAAAAITGMLAEQLSASSNP